MGAVQRQYYRTLGSTVVLLDVEYLRQPHVGNVRHLHSLLKLGRVERLERLQRLARRAHVVERRHQESFRMQVAGVDLLDLARVLQSVIFYCMSFFFLSLLLNPRFATPYLHDADNCLRVSLALDVGHMQMLGERRLFLKKYIKCEPFCFWAFVLELLPKFT